VIACKPCICRGSACRTPAGRSLLLVAVLLILVCAAGYATDEEGSPRFRLYGIYGTAGHADGQFMHPMGMAVSPDGKRLAICDTDNNRVVILGIRIPIPTLPDQPDAVSTQPFRVELTIGDIWPWEGSLAPNDAHDRWRETDNADGVRSPRELPGRAYMGGQGRVRPASNVPMDHFNRPQAITWKDDETLIVADTDNHRIKAVKLDGEIQWILGQEGWKDGYFHHPLGVDIDTKGNLYVCEPRSGYLRGLGLDVLQRQSAQGNRLQMFGPDLKPVKRAGHMHHMSGRFDRQFKDLVRIWAKPDGGAWITDSGNHRILELDSDLRTKRILKEWPFAKLRYPQGVHGDASGRLVIADTGNNRVVLLGSNSEILQILGGFGVQPGRFSLPREAKFGPYGYLFVLDTQNCRIQVYREPWAPEPAAPPVEKPASLPATIPGDSL